MDQRVLDESFCRVARQSVIQNLNRGFFGEVNVGKASRPYVRHGCTVVLIFGICARLCPGLYLGTPA